MELFLPSLLVLLIAAGIVFVALPRFGPATLAVLSLALLVFGVYQHMNTFGTEYRLSTWQMMFSSFTPFLMLGAVLAIIAIYILFLSPFGAAKTNNTAFELPNLPEPESATNAVTETINKGLQSLGLGNKGNNNSRNNAEKPNNRKNNTGAGQGIVQQANQAVTKATNQVTNLGKNIMAGLKNTMGAITGQAPTPGATPTPTPSPAPTVPRVPNNMKRPNLAGEPRVVSGLPFPLSQA